MRNKAFNLAPLALVSAMAFCAGSVHAQANRAFDAPQKLAIDAQPLGPALNEVASQAGLQLLFPPELVSGKSAPAVSGTLTPREAVTRLLAGSGLVAVPEGNAVVVKPAPASQASSAPGALPEVVVMAVPSEMTEGTGSYTTGSTSAATGLNLSLRETPQSVTVVTRQRMDDQALDSLQQVLAYVPGISITTLGSLVGGMDVIYSRGYEVQNIQVDGVIASTSYFGNSWQSLSSVDSAIYDSVTVIRGATGLLDGAGNPSGSVNMTRKRPTEQFQASVAQSLGRWDQRRTEGDVGGPLNAAGTLRGRLVAAYDEGRSQLDRYQAYKSAAYGVLEADLSERTLLSLGLEHGRQTASNGGPHTGFNVAFTDGTPTPFSRSDNNATDWSHYHSDYTALSARLEHRFNDDWQGRLGYSYSSSNLDRKTGNLDTNATALDGIVNVTPYWQKLRSKVHTLDGRLEGKYELGGRTHDLIVGFNASDTDAKNPWYPYFYGDSVQVLGWDGSGYPEPDWSNAPYSIPSETQTEQSGLYLATRLYATDALSFIAGGRLSSWETQTRSYTTGALTDDRKESAVFTPYAAVIYDLNRNLSAYASYTEIFNPQNRKDVNDNFLDPETGKNVELGLKGEWFDGRLNTSAAVFQSGKDNLAVRDGDNLTPSGAYAYRAEDDTQARGWELEASGELARGWHAQAGYTRVVLKDGNGAPLTTNYQPKHQLKLFSTWTPARLQRLTVGGGVLWQSETYDSSATGALRDLYTQKSYAVFNLMGRYAFDDSLSLSVNLNNLFDKTYRTMVSRHSYGAGRNVYATLKYQF